MRFLKMLKIYVKQPIELSIVRCFSHRLVVECRIANHAKQLNLLLQTIEDSGHTLKLLKYSFAVSEINVHIRAHSFKQRNPAGQQESRSGDQRTSSRDSGRSTLVPWPC